MSPHSEVEQRLEPALIGGGRDHDQPTAVLPLLPLRRQEAGQGHAAIGLRQGEVLEKPLALLVPTGRLDHAQLAVVADQANGAPPAQGAVGQ